MKVAVNPLLLAFLAAVITTCWCQDPTAATNVGPRVRVDSMCVNQSRQRLPLSEECSWHYIAYFPRIFRSGVYENVLVSTHGFPGRVQVTVELLDSNNKDVVFREKENNLIEPGILTHVPIYIPHNSPSSLKISVSGLSVDNKWKFTNTSGRVTVQKLGLNIFLQTDRPLYKPGETIRMRVLVVDTKLMPHSGLVDSVTVENPSGSRMMQWSNVTLEEGFASFKLPLSEKPVMGMWKIKANTETYKKELSIEVKKYVLPKFQVTVKPPPFIVSTQPTIKAKICAKYSFGKSVVGKMSVKICAERTGYYSYRKKSPKPNSCVEINTNVYGCTDVTIDSEELNLYRKEKGYWGRKKVTISANVTEIVTGLTMTAEQSTTDVQTKQVTLSFENTNVFKPGFPLAVTLLAKNPDGTPISDLIVKVVASARGVTSKLFEGDVEIKGGTARLNIGDVPFNAQNVDVRATYIRAAHTSEESEYDRKSSANVYFKPWYSPSHSYLKIKKPGKPFKKNDIATIDVGYTSVDTEEKRRTIYYSMMCAGNVAASGYFETTFIAAVPQYSTPKPTTVPPTQVPTAGPDGLIKLVPQRLFPYWEREFVTRPPLPFQFSTGDFQFRFQVTKDMMPSCRMVVYYIRGEEMVADNVEIDIVDEFENQVSMEFEEKELKPGEMAKLSVKGYPGSRIAITAVDKSIHFLAKGNDLKEKQLLDVREKLDVGPGYVDEYSRCNSGGSPWGRFRRSTPPFFGGNSDYVDSEKAFAGTGFQLISSLDIDVRPCSMRHPMVFMTKTTRVMDGGPVGVSGQGVGGSPDAPKAGKKSPPTSKPRKDFPETWLWTDERLSSTDGTRVFDIKVPDTITTWYASGFAVSSAVGVGVAKSAELRAFQPFFVSLHLPYSVIRGEDVTVPAAVFSYLQDGVCVTVRITLAYSKEYKMIAGPSATTCLCGGKTAKVLFRIKPRVLGQVKIQVGAATINQNKCFLNQNFDSSVQASDLLIKKLRVEPEGVSKEYAYNNFFCLKNDGAKLFDDVPLRLPDNVVDGSVHSRITLVGDIMGNSLSNMDKLLAMPYGCGEQNMLKFAPNIFIMNYLKNTYQVTEEIKSKALGYMRSGYQRELTYKHSDGAYSAFGERDEEGSTWLTAFVLKSYAQARPWITVDDRELIEPRKWLLKHQSKRNGCFPIIGTLHHKAMKGGVKSPATLTAYVMVSLLEAGLAADSPAMTKAKTGCLAPRLDEIKDSYSLAILAYTYAKLKDPAYNKVMQKLDEKVISKDGLKHWEEEATAPPKPVPWWGYQAKSTDIEMTSYVLLAILEYRGRAAVSDTVSIVRWLSKQRNSLGGWSSTQDTVLAMQALSMFAEQAYGSDGLNMEVDIRAGSMVDKFTIAKQNSLVLQRMEKFEVPSTVKMEANGKGCALLQVSMTYNVMRIPDTPSFVLTVKSEQLPTRLGNIKTCVSQKLTVCSAYIAGGASNMALTEVTMVSGFTTDQESLDKALETTKGLKDVEIKDKAVVFYWNYLNTKKRCVTFTVHQTEVVRKTKQAPARTYDYYDTDKEATTMYGFNGSQCRPNTRAP